MFLLCDGNRFPKFTVVLESTVFELSGQPFSQMHTQHTHTQSPSSWELNLPGCWKCYWDNQGCLHMEGFNTKSTKGQCLLDNQVILPYSTAVYLHGPPLLPEGSSRCWRLEQHPQTSEPRSGLAGGDPRPVPHPVPGNLILTWVTQVQKAGREKEEECLLPLTLPLPWGLGHW